MKEENWKTGPYQNYKLMLIKRPVIKMKRQGIDWEKIFIIY